MRSNAPFKPDDLADLERLYEGVRAVVPMRAIAAGETDFDVIGVRHDVDDNKGSLDTALKMAEWERDRGYNTTYFLLHSASYWADLDRLRKAAWTLENLGHEVGIHVNALATAIRTGRNPHDILHQALLELRSSGVWVTGAVAHGDELCRRFTFVNDEQFAECSRPGYGGPDRWLGPAREHRLFNQFQIEPRSLSDFGLEYDSNWLPRRFYVSESGGEWNKAWDEVVREGWSDEGQLHMLIHPDWWGQAFV